MKRDDTRRSGLDNWLRQIRHCKHRKNALIRKLLKDTRCSARQSEGEDDGADETCGRNGPERSSSKGKSSNIVRETMGPEDFSLTKDISVSLATGTSCKQKDLPAGDQRMRARQHDEESGTSFLLTTRSSNTSMQADCSDSTFRKLDRSNVAAKGSSPKVDKAGSKNLVASASTESTKTSHVTSAKSLAKQCTERPTSTQSTAGINTDITKMQIKRKLAPNEDDASMKRTRKENTLAHVNVAIDDIRVSNNNKRSIHEESTEDEQVTEDKKRMIRRKKRRKRCSKSEKDTFMSEAEARKPVEDIRNIFRSLFGENISGSESEEERALLESAGYITQVKSIDSCGTEARDSSDNDNASTCKVHTTADDSRKDVVKDENPLRTERKVESSAGADTEDVISKNDISVAKVDTQVATQVTANMKGYVSKRETRKLFRYLRQNLTKMVQKTFEKISQTDKWSSDIREALRRRRSVYSCNNDKKKKKKNSFSLDGDANASRNPNSSAFPTKLIFDVEDKGSDDSYNTVDLLTPIKGIFMKDTSAVKVDCELISEKGSCSILLSDDDNSDASTVIINHDETPIKENIQKDKADTFVNGNLCINTFPNQSPMDTDNNQPLLPDTSDADNEVELEIKINSKSESMRETLSLKIPPSKRVEYIKKFRNNIRCMMMGIYPEIATSANASRTEMSDVSEESPSTDPVVTFKNLRAMTHDADCTTGTSGDRSLQKENSQDDLNNNRENMTESNETGNDQCVQSIRQKSTEAALNSAENSAEFRAPVSDLGESSSAKNSQNKSGKANKGTLRKNITADFRPGRNSTPFLNLTIPHTSNTTSTITTTVASSQMSLQMNTSSTTNVSASSVSSSTPTWVSTGNNQYSVMIMNEENKLLCNISMLIKLYRIFTRHNTNNQQDRTYSILTILTILRKKIIRLKTLLLRNNKYCNWLSYIVYKLNFNFLQNSPTSLEEVSKILPTSVDIMANKTNAAIDDQRVEANTNNAENMVQQIRGTTNSSQQQFSSDLNPVLQAVQAPYPTVANSSFPRGSDNANTTHTPETNSQSANINRQQSSDNTNNILKPPQSENMALNINQGFFPDNINNILSCLQQSDATTESIERQQSSDNTNNTPLIPQSSQVTANKGRQQFPTNTSNISLTQQLSPLTKKTEQRQLSTNVDNIPRMPQTSSATVNIRQPQSSNSANSIPLTANVGQFPTNTSNIPHMQQPSPTTESINNMRLPVLANMQNIKYTTNKNLDNVARIAGHVQLSKLMTMHNNQQFPRNISYASCVLNPGQHIAMEKYQQFNNFTGLQPSGNVSNVPVSHSAVLVSNVNQMSQNTNITVNSVREPLRDLLYVNNQQQFCPEYTNCRALLGPRNVPIRPVPAFKIASSLPTNTIASDSIRQGRETSQRTNSQATISESNVQRLRQVNFQQQLHGSITTLAQDIQPSYSNVSVVMNTRPVNPFISPQTQIHTPYQIPVQYGIHSCPILTYLPQSHSPLNPMKTSATNTNYLNPVASQQIRQNDFVPKAVSDMPIILHNAINVPSGTQQTVTPNKTKQKRKYTRRLKPAPATSSHSELAHQKVPESPLSSGERNVPQTFASNAGAASLEPYASQKKTNDVPLLSHTRETFSAKHMDNASTQMSVSQEDSVAKLSTQKQKKDTPTNVITEDSPNFRTLLTTFNRPEDLSSFPNRPSNSESQDTTQSIKNAQKSASQSAVQNTSSFNLGVFTEIQNLIIQSQLKTYFETSFKEVRHVLTNRQVDVLKMEKHLLRCFYNFLRKYLGKFERKDGDMTNKENEAQSLLGKQKESAKQDQTTESRCDEKLQKDASTTKATTETTSEDLSTRPQNEESLRTSNLPKPATTETPPSGIAELPKSETEIEKLNVPRENSYMSREDSAMVTRDTAKSDESVDSIEHESQSQKSSAEQLSNRSSPVLVIDTQSSADNSEKELDSDGTSFVEHELDICVDNVTEHEHKKLENLSEDVKINSTDLCQSSPEAQNSKVTSKQSTPKCNFEKLERNSKIDVRNVSPIKLRRSVLGNEVQYFKIDEESMLMEEKTQIKKVSQDSETSEQTCCGEKYDRSRTSSIEILRWEDEEEETRLSSRNKLGASDGQLDDSLKLEHQDEEPQVFLIKHEDISKMNFIINRDFFIEDGDTRNSTEMENAFNTDMLAIFDVCSISQNSYEKIDSNTILMEDDKPQFNDEKENKKLSNLSDNSEIVDEQDIKCLRCKRTSTVCCENCLKAYYCSKRCSNLHWNSIHYKSCKPPNCSI